MNLSTTGRERMEELTEWLLSRKAQLLWCCADNRGAIERRVDYYSSPAGGILVLTTRMDAQVTYSLYAEAGAGLSHAERMACMDVIHAVRPGAEIAAAEMPPDVPVCDCVPAVVSAPAEASPATVSVELPTQTSTGPSAPVATRPKGSLF